MATVTEKPINQSGLHGHEEATGQCLFFGLNLFVQSEPWMKQIGASAGFTNKTVIIEGYGKVGSMSAIFIHAAGAKIIGIAELAGSIFNKDGINPKVGKRAILRSTNYLTFIHVKYRGCHSKILSLQKIENRVLINKLLIE